MKFEDLIKDIETNNLKSVYLFYGEEIYLMDYSIQILKQKYVANGLETLNYVVLDGETVEMQHIYNACETLPFMSQKKIVIINDLNIFGSKKKGERLEKLNAEKDELKNYISKLGDYVCLVFVEKNGDIDKRKGIIKNINKFGGVVEFTKFRGRSLNDWVEKAFKKHKKTISYYDISYFIENSSYFDRDKNKNLYDLENEIIKLSNFVEDRKKITKKDIDEVMTKSLDTNIFKLLDSIAIKDVNNSLRVFNEMCISNEPIPLILHMVIRQIRLIFMFKLLEEKGYDRISIMKKLKISNYECQKISKQSKNFSKVQLERVLALCLKSDVNIKSGTMDAKLVLEMLIVQLSQ